MPLCSLSPLDKRIFAQTVGNHLLKRHGKHPYYTVDEVKSAVDELGYPPDGHCWALAIFTAPADFSNYHRSIGEVCDLALMKADMLVALTDGASTSWFEVDLSWLDWPDIDLSGIFDVLG